MSLTSAMLRVYFVMGSQDCRGKNPVEVLEEAIAGGITLFQFREKGSGLTIPETLELGRQLRDLCRSYEIPFIMNDRVDLALLLDADGVHVGQEDIPAQEVRKLIGSDRILGVSVETPTEALLAKQNGADYIGVGPMYTTSSKPDAGTPIGPDAIASIHQQFSSSLPIVGIGGVNADNALPVIQAGASGVAVISAIAAADSPEKAAKQIREIVEKGLQKNPAD